MYTMQGGIRLPPRTPGGAAAGGRLSALDLAERAARPCLEPGRADFVPGSAICLEAPVTLCFAALAASDRGLPEGILCEILEVR